ncbi:hypothetical protein MJ1_0587 [Nanobdella aerobiophila]|uniref:Uncharacterized protein n=1 Tax=Nanobdella aerobiophila TaxID=2586965 RepID=A0A915SIL3_9ARCH|nr:hypothetical protein MJ1_0587 [Nanobdella aerobiophila]
MICESIKYIKFKSFIYRFMRKQKLKEEKIIKKKYNKY